MKSSFFLEMLNKRFSPDTVLDLTDGKKVLIMSDFHMGSGRRDDFKRNGEMVTRILEDFYYRQGWNIILNGDIEELATCSYRDIKQKWPATYRVFDQFSAGDRLYKTLGNHDEGLPFVKDYPYPLYNVIRLETSHTPIYVFHGHQSSRVYTDFNYVVRLALRYLFKPLGILNIRSARNPRRRFHVEKQAYKFSTDKDCISVIAHTHRPLFESLGRFEYIKFEIERLCRDYPASQGEARVKIEKEVKALRGELKKLKRSERRSSLRASLYGDELPVPCLFNSGSVIGKKGIYAIEVDNEHISLIYWFAEGRGKKFVRRGDYTIEDHNGYFRSVLNQNRLDYIKAKIELFSNKKDN
ncbi:MAG: metallophosphatase family protein [Treponema sp.]|nr:metallophosphatase family protein [Treponema sp.]